ncbi:MAG: hypothetical protein U0N09_06900 [Alistipes dispar]
MKRYFLFPLLIFVVSSTIEPNVAMARKPMRLICYNIADGMWYDQYNRYDRFVAWAIAQNPDVFALCEAATHWNEHRRTVPADEMPRYLPDSLSQLAARWGHRYIAVGPYQDNYPVAITSKRPIRVIQRLGGTGLSHGALHVQIDGINYVVLHLWPHKYSKDDPTRRDNHGDIYRLGEIQRILDSTILNSCFAAEKHWMMMGDFNVPSPVDSAYLGSKNYDVHTLIRNVYPHDIIAEQHPGVFIPSVVKGNKRIDFVYCTDELFKSVIRAEIPVDAFTDVASDHRPVLIEFLKSQ